MVLLPAVIAGFVTALLVARIRHCSLPIPNTRLFGLVFIAFLLQWLAFGIPRIQKTIPDGLAAFALVASQGILLYFVWSNRRHPGFWILGLGLLMNFCVIVLNGGFMPISPETVSRLIPQSLPADLHTGARFGTSRDVILPITQTHLPWLSDLFILPIGFFSHYAFSLGDILIALGAYWFLTSLGVQGVNKKA